VTFSPPPASAKHSPTVAHGGARPTGALTARTPPPDFTSAAAGVTAPSGAVASVTSGAGAARPAPSA